MSLEVKSWGQMSSPQQTAMAFRFGMAVANHSQELATPHSDIKSRGILSHRLGFYVITRSDLLEDIKPHIKDFEDGINAIEFRLGSWQINELQSRFHNTVSFVRTDDLEQYELDAMKASKRVVAGLGYRQQVQIEDHKDGCFRTEGEKGDNRWLLSQPEMSSVHRLIEFVEGLKESADIQETTEGPKDIPDVREVLAASLKDLYAQPRIFDQ
jgi:hypothetical protein